MGSIERNIAKQAVRSGQPIPDRIRDAPELRLGLMLYLQAFFDLDSSRSVGMGLGSIPWLAMKQYADYYEFDADQTESLMYFLRAMDAAYLAKVNADANTT